MYVCKLASDAARSLVADGIREIVPVDKRQDEFYGGLGTMGQVSNKRQDEFYGGLGTMGQVSNKRQDEFYGGFGSMGQVSTGNK